MKRKLLFRCVGVLLGICILFSCSGTFAFGEEGSAAVFSDVPAQAWYREAVDYTVGHGYFSGVRPDRFAPSAAMTRAMMAAVLWRVAGSPEPAGNAPFSDVKPDRYYAKAVAWAYENGVVSGTAPDKFSPDAQITRQQMAAMLYQFAASLGRDLSRDAELLLSYPDRGQVSGYATAPMGWAVTHYILRGRARNGISYLSPKQTLTRAEAALMIQRFDQQILQGLTLFVENPAETEEPAERLTLWINGIKLEAQPLWEGEPCVRAGALVSALGGSFFAADNLCLRFCGHTVFLNPKEPSALVDGAPTVLSTSCRFYDGAWYVPSALLSEQCGFQTLRDESLRQIFYTLNLKNTEVSAGKRVAILRYHCVSDDVWGDEEAFVSPAVLEAQIVRMKELGCTFLTFEELDQVDQYELPVLLTFDDGYRDNYTDLFPILQRQNVKATIFMITKYVGGSRSLTAEQIKEMYDSGLVSIQSHTQNHKDLRSFTEEELRTDFETSQLVLARITGKIPFVLCYPRGMSDEQTERVAAEYFQFGLLANTSPYITGTNPYAASRFGMHRSLTEEDWIKFILP